MSERIQNSPEHNNESQEALEKAGHERSAEIANELERSIERGVEDSEEKAKQEALEAASKAEKKTEQEQAPAEKRRDTPAQRKANGKKSFTATMKETQSHMSPGARTFSKLIHNRSVEKASETVGSTIARPNAILAGSITAFAFSLIIYLVANHNGYPLSGSETIATFIIGWAIGLLFDYVRLMATGKKS